MSLKMGFRWFGEGNDTITPAQIKQIPGVSNIVWALHQKMPGEIWEKMVAICGMKSADPVMVFMTGQWE